MQNNPKVSIIIPVFNGSKYLKEAIDSALNQTYTNCEVIVVNDGSTDKGETERIAKSYGSEIMYYFKTNGGVSSALNYGISVMTGDYFSWLSHDDVYSERKIENQIKKLENEEDNTIAVCNALFINEKSELILRPLKRKDLLSTNVFPGREMFIKLLSGYEINGCALLIPKSAFQQVGLFDQKLRYNQDYDMWYRLCLGNYQWTVDNSSDVFSRIHSEQVTRNRKDLLQIDSERITKKILPELVKIGGETKIVFSRYCLRYACFGCKKAVSCCITEGKRSQILNNRDVMKIKMMELYGRVRPQIKKIGFKLLK